MNPNPHAGKFLGQLKNTDLSAPDQAAGMFDETHRYEVGTSQYRGPPIHHEAGDASITQLFDFSLHTLGNPPMSNENNCFPWNLRLLAAAPNSWLSEATGWSAAGTVMPKPHYSLTFPVAGMYSYNLRQL
jgi:hypothetical protein